MRFIWPIVKETAVYFWDDLFHLVVFNVLTIITLSPGIFILQTSVQIQPSPSPLVYGPLVVLAWLIVPYMLFSFYWTAYDISEGKAIKFSTFFRGGRQMLKHAYIWWSINVIVVSMLILNLVFYLNLGANWSGYVSMFFFGLTLTWILIQLFALTLYPRLVEPGFRVASRNALALIAGHPIAILFAGILSIAFIVFGLVIPPLGWFGSLAIVVMITNMTTHLIIKDTFDAEQPGASG